MRSLCRQVSHAVEAAGHKDPNHGRQVTREQAFKVFTEAGFTCGLDPSWKDNPKSGLHFVCSRHFHNDRGNYDQCVYDHINCSAGQDRCRWDTRCTTDKCDSSKTPLPMKVEKAAPAKGKAKGKRR